MAKRGRKRGDGRRPVDEDGEPVPIKELTPNQQVIRFWLVRYFDHDRQVMAEAMGCTDAAIGLWVTAQRDPKLPSLQALAHAVDVKHVADLWVPDQQTHYLCGRSIRPGERGYAEIRRHAIAARPDLGRGWDSTRDPSNRSPSPELPS